MRERRATAVVGAGRLARALAPLLAAAGRTPLVIVARRGRVRGVAGARGTTDLRRGVEGVALVLIAVPDRAIAEVAARLAALDRVDWRGRVVLHHAGALGPEPLAPLARRGAETGVLHPLQCLGGGPPREALLRGSRARIEGTPRACAVARRLAREIGLVPLRFPRPLDAADRTAYHTAGALVSNDLVALVALAAELLQATGLDRAAAVAALAPLVRGTLGQLERSGLGAAITGPVSRGDLATLEQHLRRLRVVSRDDAEIHRLLSRRLARVAATHGSLAPRELRRLLRATGLPVRRGL